MSSDERVLVRLAVATLFSTCVGLDAKLGRNESSGYTLQPEQLHA
jgi:hypothetical protein